MEAFTFESLPGRVVFGAGRFAEAADEVARLQARRVLLIADAASAEAGDTLVRELGDTIAGRIDEVQPHVPVERASAAVDLARRERVDVVVTIGGGSATGLGKAVALHVPVAMLAVPTTYAGSEMTPIWGLTSGDRKTTGRDPRVQPRTVIYDPILTLSLPPSIAGPSGMNALAHCVEALYADGANPITSLMAEKGIRVLNCGLPRIVVAPDDLDARSEVLAGAYLAGAAFAAAGSSIHHKICHVLGGAYDLPHAEMHTVILPQALAFVASFVPEAMARLAAALGEEAAPAAVFDLARRIGAPTDLQSIGMLEEDIDAAAALIVEAAAGGRFPVTVESMVRLLRDAFEGREPPGATGRGRDGGAAARPARGETSVPAIST